MLNKENRSLRRPPVKRNKITQRKLIPKKLAISIIIAISAVLIYSYMYKYTNEAKVMRKLETTQQELKAQKSEVESKSIDTQAKQSQINDLNKQLEDVKNQLQAKRNTQIALAEAQEKARTVVANPGTPITGDKHTWLAASNIPQSDWADADWIITRESGWRPTVINSIGACGLGQALPCSKLPCQLTDPVCQLNWINGYVNGRYGGFSQAKGFWQAHNWY